MKTKNLYKVPIATQNIIRKDKSSPAHIGRLKYALDFLCDEGTPIHAALDGKIVKVVNDKTAGGSQRTMDDAGNNILIEHENGEFSHYAHFKHQGITVKEKQNVKAGDLLGYSGNTGFSFGPHLHFSVIRFTGKGKNDFESLAIRWQKEKTLNSPRS